jgi:hypothetical protein
MRLGYGQDIEKDDDFTVNASANNVFVTQYMVFTSLKSYAISCGLLKDRETNVTLKQL